MSNFSLRVCLFGNRSHLLGVEAKEYSKADQSVVDIVNSHGHIVRCFLACFQRRVLVAKNM